MIKQFKNILLYLWTSYMFRSHLVYKKEKKRGGPFHAFLESNQNPLGWERATVFSIDRSPKRGCGAIAELSWILCSIVDLYILFWQPESSQITVYLFVGYFESSYYGKEKKELWGTACSMPIIFSWSPSPSEFNVSKIERGEEEQEQMEY